MLLLLFNPIILLVLWQNNKGHIEKGKEENRWHPWCNSPICMFHQMMCFKPTIFGTALQLCNICALKNVKMYAWPAKQQTSMPVVCSLSQKRLPENCYLIRPVYMAKCSSHATKEIEEHFSWNFFVLVNIVWMLFVILVSWVLTDFRLSHLSLFELIF